MTWHLIFRFTNYVSINCSRRFVVCSREGGELILCESCPRAYHVACLGLDAVPKGALALSAPTPSSYVIRQCSTVGVDLIVLHVISKGYKCEISKYNLTATMKYHVKMVKKTAATRRKSLGSSRATFFEGVR